jgi:hypothetical protein
MREHDKRKINILRDEAVYVYYLKVIKQHGLSARFIDKRVIYEQVAEPFFITGPTVSRIVRAKLVERKKALDEGLHKRLLANIEFVIDALKETKRVR